MTEDSQTQRVLLQVDAEDRIVDWGPQAEAFFGQSKAVIGRTVTSTLLATEAVPAYKDRLQQALLNNGQCVAFDTLALGPDGSPKPVQWVLAFADAPGTACATHFVSSKPHCSAAERELELAVGRHKRLLRTVRSIVISLDLEGRVTEWNPTAEQIFNREADEAIGRKVVDLGIDWPTDSILGSFQKVLRSGQVERLDDISLHVAGREAAVLGLTMTPVSDEDDRCHGVLILGANITARRKLESQLAQSQRLESIGRLAAGIAHEINTPTQFVGDNIRFLRDSINDLLSLLATYNEALCGPKEDLGAGIKAVEAACEKLELDYLKDEIPTCIKQSLDGLDRIATIVRAMKEFSHPSSECKAPSDINRALRSTVMVARSEWKYVCDIEFDLDSALPPVPCHLNELNQVFLNVLVNASHAAADVHSSDAKGLIIVRTRVDDQEVLIDIQDDGCGMDEATRVRAFDPFFTTKDVGRGTGQGLALAHDVIVNKHGGTISVASAPGKGSTFTLRLPLHPQDAASLPILPAA